MRDGKVRHLAAREARGRELSVVVSMRFAYLAVLRVFGWLALLTRLKPPWSASWLPAWSVGVFPTSEVQELIGGQGGTARS